MAAELAQGNRTAKDCPFCGIARGDVPAWIVFRDPQCLAFLDRRPLFPGHCLLIPVLHFRSLQDLPESQSAHLFVRARLLSRAVEEVLQAEGTFLAINDKVSQSVDHLHVHIVPRRRKDGLRGFFWPRQKYQDEQQAAGIQANLKARIEELVASG